MGIKISELELYTPDIIVDVKEHCGNSSGLLNVIDRLGRSKAHKTLNTETSIDMAVKSASKILRNNIELLSSIEMLVYVSDTQEYSIPCNAVILKDKLNLNTQIVLDLNSNCTGMVSAMDLVSIYMKQNNLKKALIVGSINNSQITGDNKMVYCISGDASISLLLENTEGTSDILCCTYRCNSELCTGMIYPKCGYSRIQDDEIAKSDKYYVIENSTSAFFVGEWILLLNKAIEKTGLTKDSIKYYLFSQFSKNDIETTIQEFVCTGYVKDKYIFIADEYGYTGCTSPFIAMKIALNKGKIQRGDIVAFCTVGAGYTMNVMLLRY